MYFRSADVLNIQNEFKETLKSRLRGLHNILVPDDVNGNLGVDPKLMEVLPDGDILLDKLRPKLWEVDEVLV